MLKYCGFLVLFLVAQGLALVLAPLLPLFATMRPGPSDNGAARAFEPRLPAWLSWFDTSYDNGLWGDAGWRALHAPTGWGTWGGMVMWLWRNRASGFCWSRLGWPVAADETFDVMSTGCGLALDKNASASGWFLVTSSRGAFQYRAVLRAWRVQFSLDVGWGLSGYVFDPANLSRHPRAIFRFSPALRFRSV